MRRPPIKLTAPALVALVAFAGLAACGPSEEEQAADSKALEATIREYLPRLAEAYSSGDAEVLEGIAAPKEVARVQKQIDELAGRGRILEPEFRELKLEKFEVWGYANAFVNTVEIWDIRSYSTGGHQQIGESIGESNRVKYQLKRDGDQWLVLYRTKSD